MQNEVYETWNVLTAQAIDNFKRLGETNLALGEKLLREQVDLATALVETATAGAQDVASSKDVKDIAARQAAIAQECGKRFLQSTRQCADIVAEAGKAYNSVFEAGVKAARETATKTTKKAA